MFRGSKLLISKTLELQLTRQKLGNIDLIALLKVSSFLKVLLVVVRRRKELVRDLGLNLLSSQIRIEFGCQQAGRLTLHFVVEL